MQVITTNSGSVYTYDAYKGVINNDRFGEVDVAAAQYSVGSPAYFTLKDGRQIKTSSVVDIKEVDRQQLHNPDVALFTRSGSVYTVDSKNMTISGGRFSDRVEKFTSHSPMLMGSSVTFKMEDGNTLRTSTVDKARALHKLRETEYSR